MKPCELIIIRQVLVEAIADKMTDTNQQENYNDAERYFTVETARGYILINRKYEYVSLSLSVYVYFFIVSKINSKVLIF